MTLKEWADKQLYRIEYIGPGGVRWASNPATADQATIPDGTLVDRAEAWRLDDWLVSSVIAGSIWFIPRRRNPNGS